ncbi:MAG TPA: ABC transporter permease [Terriglobales bacterium]|nr:ABC transporter permease [Terriglobales bacterium]
MSLFRANDRDEELNAEIEAHLKMAERDRVERGATATKAHEAALREFGNVGLVTETTRAMWGSSFWERLIQDLRFGARSLRKTPGFTFVAVLSLALGIGGNATVFSWVQAVLLHPLAGVPQSNRLVAVETVMPNGEYHTSSYPDYRDFRDQNHVFSGVVGAELINTMVKLPQESEPERNWGEIVTENFFDVFGVQAEHGRFFHQADAHGLNSDPDVVLSYRFWQKRFGADPHVIGSAVTINQHPFTVIGIAPPGFTGAIVGIAAQYWVPIMMEPVAQGADLEYRAPGFIHILGRLRPGVSIEQANSELQTISARLQSQYPANSKSVGVHVFPLWEAHYGLQPLLLPVLGFLTIVVVLVLLIACANVANLLLARATVREREIALRAALGASRARLVRQLLSESLVLAVLGGIGGVALAYGASNLLMYFLPPAHLPMGLPLGLDVRVLLFTLALTLVTAVLFGLTPALQASRPNVNQSLQEGGRTASGSAGRQRLRNLLVVTETVLSVVLLVGAGLLVRSLRAAEHTDPGFNPEHVLLAAMSLGGSNGYTDVQAAQFYGRLVEQLKTLPGVKSASMEHWVPLWFEGRGSTRPTIEGYTFRPEEDHSIDYNVVGQDYFGTMQIPLLQGRDFSLRDNLNSPMVCIVNETMAKRFWPGQNPIGHRLNSWGVLWTIVGVAKDTKYHSMNEQRQSFLYFPLLQDTESDANILIRTDGPPLQFLTTVRAQVHALDPAATIVDSDDLGNLLSVSLFSYRIAASLSTVLGILGLLLASVGLYGVLSYSVNQRRQEIGIRMALGADRRSVLRLVVGGGLRLSLIGIVLGLAAALIFGRGLGSLLYGVQASDPVTLVGVAIVLLIVGLLACYLPARRATLVDPIVALRHE